MAVDLYPNVLQQIFRQGRIPCAGGQEPQQQRTIVLEDLQKTASIWLQSYLFRSWICRFPYHVTHDLQTRSGHQTCFLK